MNRAIAVGVGVWLGSLFLGFAIAADLKAPIEIESTQVLPQGVRNPRLKNLFMSIDSRLNGAGQGEPLGNRLNKEVTWGNLLSKASNEADRQKLLGLLKASGIDPAVGGPGATSGVINTFVNVKVDDAGPAQLTATLMR